VGQTADINDLEKVHSYCPCRESKNILRSSTSLYRLQNRSSGLKKDMKLMSIY